MVYGFVRQSGGHITIDSEPGSGTDMVLFLPRADSDAGDNSAPNEVVLPQGQGERVLIVEDDADVRTLVVHSLTRLGYDVTDLPNAEQGLNLLQQGSFDMVLSDVVLPGNMSGPDLISAARTLYPSISVLLMSGYPADETQPIEHPILRKPFERAQLARAVHDALSLQATASARTKTGGQ